MYKMNYRYVSSALILVGILLGVAVAVPGIAKYRQREAQKRSPWAVPLTAPTLREAAPGALARAFPGDSRTTLETGELTLFAVNPGYADFEEARTGAKVASFHQRPIRGKVLLTPAEKRLVLASLDDALAPNPDSMLMGGAQCFEPRHGIRSEDRNTGKRVDILICFSCHNAHLYRGKTSGSEEKDTRTAFMAFGPAANFHLNDLLRRHSISVAP